MTKLKQYQSNTTGTVYDCHFEDNEGKLLQIVINSRGERVKREKFWWDNETVRQRELVEYHEPVVEKVRRQVMKHTYGGLYTLRNAEARDDPERVCLCGTVEFTFHNGKLVDVQIIHG